MQRKFRTFWARFPMAPEVVMGMVVCEPLQERPSCLLHWLLLQGHVASDEAEVASEAVASEPRWAVNWFAMNR